MAERDTYCGLCGAGLTLPLFRASDGEDESGPVASEPGKEDTAWLAKVRILYQRTNLKTGSRSVNLSSIVVCHEPYIGKWTATGHIEPEDEFENPEPDTLSTFVPYQGLTDFSIPLHDSCCRLLVKFLDYSVGLTPKNYLEVLFKTLRSFHDRKSKTYRGSIKYGKISEQQNLFWYPTISTKYFVYDPFFPAAELEEYYDDLPEIRKGEGQRDSSTLYSMKATSETDPLCQLPPELLAMILMYLPIQSILHLRLASVTAVKVLLSGSFWRQKLKRDMSWLWDFPYKEAEQMRKNLDWLQIYKDIYIGSRGNGKSPFFNLANRRRVWRISQQLTTRFVMFQNEGDFIEDGG